MTEPKWEEFLSTDIEGKLLSATESISRNYSQSCVLMFEDGQTIKVTEPPVNMIKHILINFERDYVKFPSIFESAIGLNVVLRVFDGEGRT